MDFWHVYQKEKAKEGFGTDRLYVASRDRIHLSLSTVEKYSSLLGINQALETKFSDESRYAIAKEITHDLFISIYDVNTTKTFLLRPSQLVGELPTKKMQESKRKLKKPNLEMRILGLQNNDSEVLDAVELIHSLLKPSLVEVDLFGREMRHIVFDLKLGMVFNLLLLNRIYKPGELANPISLQDFSAKRGELKFL